MLYNNIEKNFCIKICLHFHTFYANSANIIKLKDRMNAQSISSNNDYEMIFRNGKKKYGFKNYFYVKSDGGDKYVCEEIFNGNKHDPQINVPC